VDEAATANGSAVGVGGQRLQLVAGVLALSGVGPELQPAGQLAVVWTAGVSGALELSLRASGRLGAGVEIEHAQGVAELDFVGAVVAACAGLRFARGALAAFGCAAFEPGQLSARGRDTLDPRDEQRLWLALGPAAGLAWTPFAPLVVEAGAELQVPLRRDRFLFVGETVYRVPALAVRAGVGLGVQLW